MSVINQALRDLEKRGAGTKQAEPVYVAASVGHMPGSWTPGRIIGLLLFLGALAFVSIRVGMFIGSEDNAMPVSQVHVMPEPARSEPVEPQVAEGVSDAHSRPVKSQGDLEKAGDESKVAASSLGIDKTSADPLPTPTQQGGVVQNPERQQEIAESLSRVIKENSTPLFATTPDQEQVRVVSPGPDLELKAEPKPELKTAVSASPKSLDQQAALVARRKAESGAVHEARADLESFISTHPVHEASKLELASVLVKLRDDQALDELLQGEDIFVQPEMRMIAARRLLQRNQPDQANDMLRSALPSIEYQPHYYALLASIEQKRGRHLQQIDIYRRLIETHGDRAKWWLGSAIAWDQLERYDAARRAYLKVQQLNLIDPSLVAFVDQRLKQLRGHH